MGEAYITAFHEAQRLVSRSTNTSAVVKSLVAPGGQWEPHDDWSLLAQLPAGSEDLTFPTWLEQLLAHEPPAADIVTFWFGLFNSETDDGEVTLMLYLGGSTVAPSAPDISMDYFPDGRYFESDVLNAIYRIGYATEEGIGDLAEYMLGLGYVGALVAQAARTLNTELSTVGCQFREIVVGFDGGDYVEIGMVTPAGFLAPAL